MAEKIVSIVTPCYNGENYLDRFFQSILSQTYPALELVFVNDGSTDQTEKKVNAYREQFQKKGIPLIYIRQENTGQAAALNAGLKKFKGSYLACMDSDDELLPDAIEKKVQCLEAHPEAAFCYGKAIAVNEEEPDRIVHIYGKRESSHSFFEDVLFAHDVFFPGYLIRTDAFDQVLPGREIYTGRGGQNAQILLPMGWYYGEPMYVEESVYKYFIRQNSHSRSINTSSKIIEQLNYYEKTLIESIQKIQDPKAQKYIPKVREHYARLRFGNAVDTMDPEIIRREYFKLKQLHIASLHDLAMYLKYVLLKREIPDHAHKNKE